MGGIVLNRSEVAVLHVLRDLRDDYSIYTRTISSRTGLSHLASRRAIRSLVRKELAVLTRGLFNEDDGLIAGSGYRCTPLGRTFEIK